MNDDYAASRVATLMIRSDNGSGKISGLYRIIAIATITKDPGKCHNYILHKRLVNHFLIHFSCNHSLHIEQLTSVPLSP